MLDLEPLSAAAEALPVSKMTLWRWTKRYPGIALRIGDRLFLWREAREAIAQGRSLAEASEIGEACRARLH